MAGHVFSHWSGADLMAESYEILDDPVNENILCPQGFLRLLLYCMRLAHDGLIHWGTVCSWWVWMCRGTSKRSAWNWKGDTSRQFVADGNDMVSRMVICLMLVTMRGGDWLLEQPASSLMHVHERLEKCLAMSKTSKVYMWMNAYGALTPKPSVLRGTPSWIVSLKRPLDKAEFKRTEGSRPQVVKQLNPHPDGKRRVTGEKAELKQTQEYPVAYAEKVFECWQAHRHSRRTEIIESDSENDDLNIQLEEWPEARMDNVSAFIGMQPGQLPAGLGMS